jgi:hypothetical protein
VRLAITISPTRKGLLTLAALEPPGDRAGEQGVHAGA